MTASAKRWLKIAALVILGIVMIYMIHAVFADPLAAIAISSLITFRLGWNSYWLAKGFDRPPDSAIVQLGGAPCWWFGAFFLALGTVRANFGMLLVGGLSILIGLLVNLSLRHTAIEANQE